jgi:hypothetical protein
MKYFYTTFRKNTNTSPNISHSHTTSHHCFSHLIVTHHQEVDKTSEFTIILKRAPTDNLFKSIPSSSSHLTIPMGAASTNPIAHSSKKSCKISNLSSNHFQVSSLNITAPLIFTLNRITILSLHLTRILLHRSPNYHAFKASN